MPPGPLKDSLYKSVSGALDGYNKKLGIPMPGTGATTTQTTPPLVTSPEDAESERVQREGALDVAAATGREVDFATHWRSLPGHEQDTVEQIRAALAARVAGLKQKNENPTKTAQRAYAESQRGAGEYHVRHLVRTPAALHQRHHLGVSFSTCTSGWNPRLARKHAGKMNENNKPAANSYQENDCALTEIFAAMFFHPAPRANRRRSRRSSQAFRDNCRGQRIVADWIVAVGQFRELLRVDALDRARRRWRGSDRHVAFQR